MSAVVLLCLLYSTYYFVVVWLFGAKIPTTTTQSLSVISSLLKTDFEFVCGPLVVVVIFVST